MLSVSSHFDRLVVRSRSGSLDSLDPRAAVLLRELAAIYAHEPPPTRQRDEQAARLIEEFLAERGWSSRDLAAATELAARERSRPNLTISRKTIDRIIHPDTFGHVPNSRGRAAIALVMGVPPWRIWGDGQMSSAKQREQILGAAA